MKTIRQMADELGVSKTAIRNKLTPEMQTKFAETVSGIIYLSPEGENLIRQAFKHSKAQTKFADVSANQFAEVSDQFAAILEILRDQLTIKDDQIKAKDEQINMLTAALENVSINLQTTQASLQAEQALHAGTLERQLAIGRANLQAAAADASRKSILDFFRKRQSKE